MTSPTQPWRQDLDFTGLRFIPREETLGATVHCSATPPKWNKDGGNAIHIDRMHRGRGWLCIGYHFVIDRAGTVHVGRPMDVRGAHCSKGGRNETHVSVCLMGGVDAKMRSEMNFTDAQLTALKGLLGVLKAHYGFSDDDIEGHRDVSGVKKDCPCMEVQHFVHTGEAKFR